MNSSSIITNKDYQRSFERLKEIQPEPIGITDYIGATRTDSIYPRQNNFIIALLVRILERIDHLEGRLVILEAQALKEEKVGKDIEKLMNQLGNLNLGKSEKKKQPQQTTSY